MQRLPRLRSRLVLLAAASMVPVLLLSLVLGYFLIQHEKESRAQGAGACAFQSSQAHCRQWLWSAKRPAPCIRGWLRPAPYQADFATIPAGCDGSDHIPKSVRGVGQAALIQR